MIPENLTKAETIEFLKKNKDTLIAAKKAETKYTDSISVTPLIRNKEIPTKTESSKKDSPSDDLPGERDSIEVTVVCNTANFCDSHMDVLTSDSYSASIEKRGNTIPHIADHIQKSTAHVGDVQKVYTKKVNLKELGLELEGSTTALLMDSVVRKDYNEDVFKFYSNGKINQHSIGLRYNKLYLAIDSSEPEDAAYKDVWDKYFPDIINKDHVKDRGYFWAVTEVDVMENSCVLFGANPLTPTLSASTKSDIESTYPQDTLNKPIFQPKTGATMATIEELQLEVANLKSEITTLKANAQASVAAAKSEEQTRIVGIIEAAKTLGVSDDAALKRIKSGTSVADATEVFTDIKEALQKAGHIDTSKSSATSTINNNTLPKEKKETSGKAFLLQGIDELAKESD